MDIHRCRFVPYRPQSINTLAFSHRSNPKQRSPLDLRLALGRENGDVEIWNPIAGNWVQEKILRGGRDRTVEQLAWTQDLIVDEDNTSSPFEDGALRLFSSGGSPSITEWDLVTGQQKRHAEGNVGDIWCFAAQPQWLRSGKELELTKIAAAPSQLLAAGCSNGSIVLFTTADDTLQYLSILSPSSVKKSKVISITWRDRNTVVAGYEDGYIRVIDVPTRTTTRTMSLGRTIEGSSAVVWTVKCLPDGTILSGDSSGELKIWDSTTLSLTQRIKAHDADILDIGANTHGDTIFTVGVDRRVAVFKQLPGQSRNSKGRWHKLMHRRFHEHDVKAIASFESKTMSVLVSGGMDTVPIVMPLRRWETENHRTLSHLPQHPPMSCSSKARLMLTWWDRDLFIWSLPQRYNFDSAKIEAFKESNHQLLARIELKGDEHITSAQISRNGRMIVAATAAGVKLFQLRKRMEAGEIEARTRPVDLPAGVRGFAALLVGFSPDNKWLFAVRTSGVIAMVKIASAASSKEKPQIHPQIIKLARKSRRHDRTQASHLGTYRRTIGCVSFSSDSRVLATGDLSGVMDIWILKGHEDAGASADSDDSSRSESPSEDDSGSESDDASDSRVIHGQKWIREPSGSTLPQLDSAILALGFKPHFMFSQSLEQTLGLHPTRHNPHPVSHDLPPSDTKLVAVTASHQILEFDVMSGKLSEWSRRNPSSYLPQSFKQIKDRVMGIFWDCSPSKKRERLWLYGHTWLFMLDMSRDLSMVDAQDKIGKIGQYDVREPLSASATKKQTAHSLASTAVTRKRKRNTGAGDSKELLNEGPIPTSKANGPDAMDIDTDHLNPTSDKDKDIDNPNDEEDDDDDDDDYDNNDEEPTNGNTSHLTTLRRGPGSGPGQSERRDSSEVPSSDPIDQSLPTATSNHPHQSPPHHVIYRYRSILGVAVLQPQSTDDENDNTAAAAAVAAATAAEVTEKNTESSSTSISDSNLEVVIVERPIYDVDLLPRFDGGQDWST